jgi:2'-5' RNA ligase
LPSPSSPDSPSRRLFVGTFLPAETQHNLASLREYQDRLTEHWQRRVRFIREEKLHLTWLFLGQVQDSHLPEIESRLSGIAQRHHQQELSYTRRELLPSRKFARNLVLTPDVVPTSVMALADDAKNTLREFLQRADHHHRYRPHITVMRLETGPEKTLSMPSWFPLQQLLPIHQSIVTIDLIESHMGRANDAYEILRSFPLPPSTSG